MGITGLEVPLFDQKQGAQFLITLSRQGQKSIEELAAAEELSVLLGGLPLALTLAVMHMRSIRHNFQQYFQRYRSNWDDLYELKGSALKLYYKHGLDTVWELSFSSLERTSPKASALFGVLCLMAPQEIPGDLFEKASEDIFPEMLRFCRVPQEYEAQYDGILISCANLIHRFGDTIEMLLDLALINKDPEANSFIVHRLIQHQYRNRITKEQRREYFKIAVDLMYNAFPKLGDKLSLRPYWRTCKRYVQHIIVLAALYEQFEFRSSHPGEFLELADCLSSTAWYVLHPLDSCSILVDTSKVSV